jgi:Ca2+-binding RTX toxin-like protein
MTKHVSVISHDLIDSGTMDPSPTPTQTVFDGTANADTIREGNADFFIDAGAGSDRITVGNGNDTILGGDGNDRITVGNGNDFIDGGAGNNTFTVGTGHNTIVAGDGANTVLIGDWVHGSGDADITLGNGDNRLTDYGDGNLNLSLGSGNNTLSSGGGNDVITAHGDGVNYIQGGAGNDIITDSDGSASELEGEEGDDTIFANGGDDNIVYGAGDGHDTVDGGTGTDTLELDGSNTGGSWTLSAEANGHAQLTQNAANGADMVNVEHIEFDTAGDGDETVTPNSDTINIGEMAGTDVKLVTIDLEGSTPNTGDGLVDTVNITGNGSEHITVSLVNGELVINGLAETIVIDDFDKNDIVNISGVADVTNNAGANGPDVNFNGAAANGGGGSTGSGGTVSDPGTGGDTGTGGDNGGGTTAGGGVTVDGTVINGTNGADTITADNGNHTIHAMDGNDTITAGNGDNVIDGGAGDKELDLGTGHNTITLGDGNNTINLGDWVNGSGAADITLGNGDNRFTDFGDGDVNMHLGDGNNSISSGGGNDTIIASGVGNDYIQGGDGDDFIQGSDGNDQELEGEGGNDTIFGMGGDDRLVFSASAGINHVGDGMDRIDGGAGNDFLATYGSAHGDHWNLSALSNGHALLMQDDGSVNNADLVSVEEIDITTPGEDGVHASGRDFINIGDMTGTGVKLVDIDLAGPNLTSGDGQVDTINLVANAGQNVTVSLVHGELVITGLAEKVVIEHFDANDVVNIEGAGHVTNNLAAGQGPIVNNVAAETAAQQAADAAMAAHAEALNQAAHHMT